MNSFVDIIQTSSDKNLLEYLVTPLAPYYICNHYISTELKPGDRKYVEFNVVNLKANDLIQNKNYNDIKELDIIQVQVDYFVFFYDEVLPIIVKNNIRVIIITSQWHYPQIQKSYKTDNLLNNNNILLWISQNPIYPDNEKYMALPYGLLHLTLYQYVDFVKHNDNKEKNIKILNQFASSSHVPGNHIRNKYDIFGKNSGVRMNYKDFLTNISNSEFVISTSGDRDDCYRHYECIGLNAIPVSNIGGEYINIFGENMIYSNSEEMINMINTKIINYNYKKPNRNILTFSYWLRIINERINLLK